jgi:LysM repeat protein
VARRRSGSRTGRRVLVLAVGAAGAFLAAWMMGAFGRSEAVRLTQEREPEAAPALRLVPPAPSEAVQPAAPAGQDVGRSRLLQAVPAPPATQPATPVARPEPEARPAPTPDHFQAGLQARQQDDLVRARDLLNRALHTGLAPEQSALARQTLAELADRTIFSSATVADDPLVEHYVVRSGDTIGKLARRFKVSEDLLVEINGITDKNFIREGRRLKVVHGPFHAAITKSNHLMHVYLQDVYVRTFRVALGADGSTPTGRWKVINQQENPGWTDPRTGRRWHPDDPENPIGEHWIGLEGVEGDAVGQFGYGIHGTIEPETIGQNVSLGCVRLAPDDVAAVYKYLVVGESYVTISD